jgi:hypothetical protein
MQAQYIPQICKINAEGIMGPITIKAISGIKEFSRIIVSMLANLGIGHTFSKYDANAVNELGILLGNINMEGGKLKVNGNLSEIAAKIGKKISDISEMFTFFKTGLGGQS